MENGPLTQTLGYRTAKKNRVIYGLEARKLKNICDPLIQQRPEESMDGYLLPGGHISSRVYNKNKDAFNRVRMTKDRFIYFFTKRTAIFAAILHIFKFYFIFVECAEYLAL